MKKAEEVKKAIDNLAEGKVYVPVIPVGGTEQKEIMSSIENLRRVCMEKEIERVNETERNKVAVAGIVHDLKTPIALISGYAECLQDGMDDKDYAKLISETASKLNELVLKLVENSKREVGEIKQVIEKVSVKPLAEQLAEACNELASRKQISFKCRKIEDAKVFADKKELERALQNILSNAVKYTDEGGKIRFSCRRSSRYVVFTVRDNGKGIDKADLPHIFDKFYMADAARTRNDSSGMGLYTAMQIAESYGGTVKASGKKGKGSVFKLCIPDAEHELRPTEQFERLKKPVKLAIIFFLGFVTSWLLRFVRFFENRTKASFFRAVASLAMWILLWPADFLCELFYNRIPDFSMD